MKKSIFVLLTAFFLLNGKTVKADEIIIHQCEATAYSLTGIAADGSEITKESNNVVASKKEWIGGTMVIFLDDGDGIIKPQNYLGTFEIRDTGSERIRSGEVIDVHVADYDTAINFGRKNVIVQVIKGKG